MMLHLAIQMMEKGLLPDLLTRWGIRALIKQRLREEKKSTAESQQQAFSLFIEELKKSPIAIQTQKANEQHYEVTSEFFTNTLGKYRKYSCCYFPEGVVSLDAAEAAMLALTCERAAIEDGMTLLELGCGWGSLTLWMAEHYPHARVTAISNSSSQRKFILKCAESQGLHNLEILTCDINDFTTAQQFDRVISVEMFEHMRNYQKLLHRIARWMNADGKLFVHLFSHRQYAYPFETKGDDNWMGKYFFSGGIMPSDHLLLYFQDDVLLERHWVLDGTHYQKTAQAWHQNMDHNKTAILSIMAKTYGSEMAHVWFHRWRVFFMSCAEVWGYHGGEEWLVSHYLFNKRSTQESK